MTSNADANGRPGQGGRSRDLSRIETGRFFGGTESNRLCYNAPVRRIGLVQSDNRRTTCRNRSGLETHVIKGEVVRCGGHAASLALGGNAGRPIAISAPAADSGMEPLGQLAGTRNHAAILSRLRAEHPRPSLKLVKNDPRLRMIVATRAMDFPPCVDAACSYASAITSNAAS